MNKRAPDTYIGAMRALCVGRHVYLSEHLCRFFEKLDVDVCAAVGMDGAKAAVAVCEPDVIVCDYDVLVSAAIEEWERDPLLSRVPVLAVSLTRRPNEMCMLDPNAISGPLYLPTLSGGDAMRLLRAAAGRAAGVQAPASLPWPGRQIVTTP